MLVHWLADHALYKLLGDQALNVGAIIKGSVLYYDMVKLEYKYLTRIRPHLLEMRNNYPDVRLDINGNFRVH